MDKLVYAGTVRRGYLENDFEFFYLKDKNDMEFEFHYHEFNKIIVFLAGKVTYLINGKAYRPKPWDVLLFNAKEIHLPLIDPDEIYERMILWIDPSFLKSLGGDACDLLDCFNRASDEKSNLLRVDAVRGETMRSVLQQMQHIGTNDVYGGKVLKKALFAQFIVEVNRLALHLENSVEAGDPDFDECIASVIEYVDSNLAGDLSIEMIAVEFHISRFHLMHKFKQFTGYTLHNFILQKRLVTARALVMEGKSATDACIETGFNDYSNFIRSFKARYGVPPGKYFKAMQD